jgi:phosphatidylinositol alpha-1,6-mannosyltransferase
MVKKVLLLLPGAFSGHGGIEMYNRQLVQGFCHLGNELGYDTRVLVLNDREGDVDERYLPRGARAPRTFDRNKRRFAVSALWRVLADRPEIVVFGHLHFAALEPVIRCIAPRIRTWFVAYGIEAWRPLPERTQRALRRADRVFAISDFTRRALQRDGGTAPDRVDLLPAALDPVWQERYEGLAAESIHAEGHRSTLLTVARLDASERYKGVDSVIRALPAVVEQVPTACYEVIGDGDDRCRLEALARSLGVHELVRFRGRLSPDELAKAYRGCALFVMPSSHEGFGIVFLEAALFAKPSVGGRHGGTPEVIEDGRTGFLTDHDDISGLAEVIVRLLREEGLALSMGEAARSHVLKTFTHEVFRRQLRSYVSGAIAHATREWELSARGTEGPRPGDAP